MKHAIRKTSLTAKIGLGRVLNSNNIIPSQPFYDACECTERDTPRCELASSRVDARPAFETEKAVLNAATRTVEPPFYRALPIPPPLPREARGDSNRGLRVGREGCRPDARSATVVSISPLIMAASIRWAIQMIPHTLARRQG
jgi:hypothetical protein